MGGGSAPGGFCSGGCLLWRGLLPVGMSALEGSAPGGDVCSGGSALGVSQHALRQTPRGQNDTHV